MVGGHIKHVILQNIGLVLKLKQNQRSKT